MLIHKLTSALVGIFLGAALFFGICYWSDAWGQYPPNTQVQRSPGGSVYVRTNPGPVAGTIHNFPTARYGRYVYEGSYVAPRATAPARSGIGRIPTYSVIGAPQAAYAPPEVPYSGLVSNIPSFMRICVHSEDAGQQTTKCTRYR